MQVTDDRTYGQYCGLARTLDLVGDRWTLLIVRELLPGPRRYRDLAASLDGIASNLLAGRLRKLTAGGVVERRLGDSGAAEYTLTSWGEGLRGPIEELVRWGSPLMASGPGANDTFDARWLAVALPALLAGARSTRVVEVGIEVRGTLLAVRVDRTGATVSVDPDRRPDTIVSGEPRAILGLVVGAVGADHPAITVDGDRRAVGSVFGRADR